MQLCAESLALSRDLGNRHGMLRSLATLARVAASAGSLEPAARLLGAVAARGSYGDAATVERLRNQLGEQAFEVAWTAGQALSLDEAITYATQHVAPAAAEPNVE
jgi:hypothetical protein